MCKLISYIIAMISTIQLSVSSQSFAASSCEGLFLNQYTLLQFLPMPYLQKNIEPTHNFVHTYLAERAWSRLNTELAGKNLSAKSIKNLTDEAYDGATLDWLKPVKTEDRLMDIWVEKQILARGFTQYLKDNEGASTPSVGRIRTHIRKILRSKVFQFLMNPVKSLTPKDVLLSEQFIENVIVDGYPRHKDALREEYKKSGQKKVEFYKKIARAVVLAIVAYTSYDTFFVRPDQIKDVAAERQKESYFESFEETERKLIELDRLLEQRGMYK